MKLIKLIFILLIVSASTAVTMLAQVTNLYEDPAGRFSVVIPTGWADESTESIGRFVAADGTTALTVAVEAADSEAGDQAALTALVPDLANTDPVQTISQPALSGTWTANIYVPAPDRMVILSTQWVDGVSYALLFDMTGQDALVANQGDILRLFNEFSIGERIDLTNVQPLPFTNDMLAELESYIEDSREQFHVPGVSISIVQDGEVLYTHGFGTTEPDGGQPIMADTLFMIGSVTKSMTTMMMGTLVDEQVFDWNTPVIDLLPSFTLSDAAVTPHIRMRDLVNMSSGVPGSDVILSLADFTPEELIASLNEIDLVAAPGEMWNYTNQMVSAGGFISALAAGAPMDGLYEGYVDLVEDRVFDAIGMPSTTFDFDTATANPNRALSYIYDPLTQEYLIVPMEYERYTRPNAPAGAVWSNADDMARYLQTELNNGIAPNGQRVISEEMLHLTQSPEITPGGLYASYGMGWGIDSYFGQPMILHGGNTLGYTTDMAFLPDADFGIVIMTNAGNANSFTSSIRQYTFELAFGLDHDITQRLANQYHAMQRDAAQQDTAPHNPVDADAIAPYLGVYEYGSCLEMRGAELWFVGAFVQTPFYPTDTGEYFSVGAFSPFRVQLIQVDDQPALAFTYPNNPTLIVRKIDQ